MPDDDALHREFALLTNRAGITIAAGREAVMFDAFLALRSLLADVHKPFAFTVEPAFIRAGA